LLFHRRDDQHAAVLVAVPHEVGGRGERGHRLPGATGPLHREVAALLPGVDGGFDGVGLLVVRRVESEELAPRLVGHSLSRWVVTS